MSSHKVTTPAPAQVTTTVQPVPHIDFKDSLFSANDIYFLLAVCVALTIVAGFFLNRASAKRKEDREDAAERTTKIMEAIKASHDDAARDVRELSDKVKEGRTVLEKDIESIRSNMRHDKANAGTIVEGLKSMIDRSALDVRDLHTRMTTQEEKSRNQDHALNELKQILREKIDETKEAIKSSGEATDKKLTMIETTIREMSKREMK